MDRPAVIEREEVQPQKAIPSETTYRGRVKHVKRTIGEPNRREAPANPNRAKVLRYLDDDLIDKTSPPDNRTDMERAKAYLTKAKRLEAKYENDQRFQNLQGTNTTTLENIQALELGGHLRGTLIRAMAAHEAATVLDAKDDKLTGLLNRKGFKEVLSREKARERRIKRQEGDTAGLYYVILDVNFLKKFNDEHGHKEGDKVLKKVADILKNGSREDDAVGRFGGDEFGVLLTETDEEGVRDWWKRINEVFEENGVRIAAGASRINPNISPTDVSAGYDSVHAADIAMYEAKNATKDPEDPDNRDKARPNQLFFA